MRHIARVDANQAEIVDALRKVGATVQLLHQVGAGCPDILAGFRGQNHLLEIKTADGRLTGDQAEWLLVWRGQVAIVRTPEEALVAIGAMKEAPHGAHSKDADP